MSLFKQFLGLRKLSRRSPLTLTLYQPVQPVVVHHNLHAMSVLGKALVAISCIALLHGQLRNVKLQS
jgi:hypothetical protein